MYCHEDHHHLSIIISLRRLWTMFTVTEIALFARINSFTLALTTGCSISWILGRLARLDTQFYWYLQCSCSFISEQRRVKLIQHAFLYWQQFTGLLYNVFLSTAQSQALNVTNTKKRAGRKGSAGSALSGRGIRNDGCWRSPCGLEATGWCWRAAETGGSAGRKAGPVRRAASGSSGPVGVPNGGGGGRGGGSKIGLRSNAVTTSRRRSRCAPADEPVVGRINANGRGGCIGPAEVGEGSSGPTLTVRRSNSRRPPVGWKEGVRDMTSCDSTGAADASAPVCSRSCCCCCCGGRDQTLGVGAAGRRTSCPVGSEVVWRREQPT